MSLIDLIIEEDAWACVALEPLAERAGRAALTHLGLDPDAHEICLLAAGDARIATLNGEFRGKPSPTNVLSWPALDLAPESPGAAPDLSAALPELGDIALAHGVCLAEAAAAGIAPEDHLTHLIVHGILHLLGYDHLCDEDAALMEGLEVQILGLLGLPDPYARELPSGPTTERDDG